jgi:hypothetical protein
LPSIKSASPVTSQNFVSESINTSLEVSYQFCRELSRAQARNFYWSFRLLDHDRRRAMCSIYAFMRQTDDIADAPGMSQAARLHKPHGAASLPWPIPSADMKFLPDICMRSLTA